MNVSSSDRIAAATLRRYGEAIDAGTNATGADALAVMNERSVCRRYRPGPVPENLFGCCARPRWRRRPRATCSRRPSYGSAPRTSGR